MLVDGMTINGKGKIGDEQSRRINVTYYRV